MEKIFANFDSTGDKSVDFEEFKVSSMRIYNDADNELESSFISTGGHVPSYK